jgi:biotin transport system substrate-specific component
VVCYLLKLNQGEFMMESELSLKKNSRFLEIVKVVAIAFCASIVIAASKPLTFYLPYTVVPVSIQPHVALLVAFLLGRTKGSLAVAFFLMQGLMGLPVIASGIVGIAAFYGPTAGYLLGYFIAALIMGSLKTETFLKTFNVLLIGNLTIYLFGAIWLSGFIGIYKAVTLGVLPFLFADYIKLLVTAKFAGLDRGYSVIDKL